MPHHFYGEMAKTDFGCHILQEKGHFKEFSQVIRQHSLESEDMELIMKLKSVLWAIVSLFSQTDELVNEQYDTGEYWSDRRRATIS